MVSSEKSSYVWAIEHDSGELLGTNNRSETACDFGARIPLTWVKRSSVKAAWLRYCVDRGYLLRGISLGGEGARFTPGPNFDFMPRVKFRRLDIRRADFELPTLEELGVRENKR